MKKTHTNKFIAIFLFLIITGVAFGQTENYKQCPDTNKRKSKKPKTSKKVAKPLNVNLSNLISNQTWEVFENSSKDDVISEKSIKVYPKVNISMCVKRGKVKVNGWERDEVRAFVVGEKKVDFKVLETDRKERPAWIKVLNSKSEKRGISRYTECLSGKIIELDVPKNTSISIKGEETEVTVDSIRKTTIKNVDGDIFLNEISNRINAQTYKGNIAIRNSRGKMYASTSIGNIVGFNTRTNEFGDYFKAKSISGAITLQSVEQSEVEVNSSSGAINYIGKMKLNGQYGFSTTSGRINLFIPAKSSCQIDAYYKGSFRSDISIKSFNKNKTNVFTHLTGQIGTGRCDLKFRTYSGQIRIRGIK